MLCRTNPVIESAVARRLLYCDSSTFRGTTTSLLFVFDPLTNHFLQEISRFISTRQVYFRELPVGIYIVRDAACDDRGGPSVSPLALPVLPPSVNNGTFPHLI